MKRALVLLALAACTPTLPMDRSVQVGEKTSVPIEDVPVKGFEVALEMRDRTVKGELLAVDKCGVYVLENGAVTGVPSPSVTRATVAVYSSKAGLYGLWMGVGALSTASHGFLLVFTLPVWVGAGIPTTVSTAGANDSTQPSANAPLFQYARFPQGLPPGFRVDRVLGPIDPSCGGAAVPTPSEGAAE